jgi:hypothetical protein
VPPVTIRVLHYAQAVNPDIFKPKFSCDLLHLERFKIAECEVLSLKTLIFVDVGMSLSGIGPSND